MAAPQRSEPRRLLIIGGAEDRTGSAQLLRRFVRLSGGRRARIVLVPTASGFQEEVAASYSEVFRRLGAPAPVVVNPADRRAAGDPELVASIDEATGVFMTGGSQLKLSQILPGTAAGKAIHAAYDRGAVIAGTSAGASIMSDFMISMGDEGLTPKQRTSQVSQGLGLLPDVIIDQHFGQRSRYGRLMSVTAASPNLIGLGIDENTAIEVTDESVFTVLGAGAVFVLDCRDATTDAPEARRNAPLLVSGARVHNLPAGATFDLRTMELTGFVEKHPDVAVVVERNKA
jgi:cyanophycinase